MSHTLSSIRELPNYRLYQLKLVRTEKPAVIVAVLTQEAIDLGVRFDNYRKDYRFNLSEFLGHDNGKWERGVDFQATAHNPKLDLSDRENRCLVADLPHADGINEGEKYNLDEALGLVDYFHPIEQETYFRLGVKVRGPPKRTLVLCFDGTSNHFSNRNTNVVKMFELLKKDDPESQMVYYQTGVGTYTSPAWTNAFTAGLAKTLDLAVAWYLYQHVIDGYKFLMETYRDGDRIYIFGFSRGAYTARALAGMLHCVGLLPRHNVEHIPFAYQIYASHKPDAIIKANNANYGRGDAGWWEVIFMRVQTSTCCFLGGLFPFNSEYNDMSMEDGAEDYQQDEFKQVEFQQEETEQEKSEQEKVKSGEPNSPQPDEEVSEEVAPSNAPLVGNPPDVAPPNYVAESTLPEDEPHGALGEGGDPSPMNTEPESYKQTFCTPIKIDFVGVWDTVGSVGAIIPRTLPFIDHNPSIRVFRHALALDEHRANFVPSLWDHSKTVKGQDVREVWFRGQHTDIGGGAPKPVREQHDTRFTALSFIPLRWMVQQCLVKGTSIAFDRRAMQLYREQGVLEYRPAQPNLDHYKDYQPQPDLSKWKKIIKDIKKKIIPVPEDMRLRLLYESSSMLDRADIKHEPFEAVGMFSPWKLLELFPSTRPAQTKEGPKMTHWPNFGAPRVIFRRREADPVYIHASVVDYIFRHREKQYSPKAIWKGYEYNELPPIESFEGNDMSWANSPHEWEVSVNSMNMDWKPPGMLGRIQNRITSIGTRIGIFIGLSSRE